MITNIIMWSVFLIINIISYYQFKNEMKFKKNIAMGVTFPKDVQGSEEIKTILSKYGKLCKNITAVLLVLSIAGMFITDFSLSMIMWGIMFLLSISVINVVYGFCNIELKKLKEEKGWKITSGKTVEVDIKAFIEFKKPSVIYFLIPLIISVICLFLDKDMWIVHFTSIISEILMYLGAVYLYRRKSESFDENTELSKKLTQIRLNAWNKIWLMSAYTIALMSIEFLFLKNNPIILTILTVIIAVIMAVFAVGTEFYVRKLQEKLTENSENTWYKDEDDYWLFGTFYYNPNDSHLLANNRTGVNTTVNLAKPMGKVLIIVFAILIIFCPILVGSLALENKADIKLQISGEEISCNVISSKYKVEIADIEETELLEKLPKGLYRVAGSGMPDLYSGRFSAKDMNNLKLIVDPNTAPYILIKTKENIYYLFGSRDSEYTEQVYEQLHKAMTNE